MLKPTFLILAAAVICIANAKYVPPDPCVMATQNYWVSSTQAHLCELNVPFNKTRSLSVIDSVIKFMQYYSTENWFIKSPNPQIPANYNLNTRLNSIQKTTQSGNFHTDWDFTIAITDALNREHDGHTVFFADCNYAFSYNLPVSIATLANSPTDATACPYFLVNYDFPNQVRPGLEAYYKGLGYNFRKYDGLQILKINGEDSSDYLVSLAQNQSILQAGLYTGFETVQTRYMRLMSRYSADTATSNFTQEVGRFAQRGFYPNAASVTITVQLSNGQSEDVMVPWSAHFTGSGNDTASFISETCVASTGSVAVKIPANTNTRLARKAVTQDDIQDSMSDIAATTPLAANYVTPNLTSYGHFVTLDIYRLQKHPKVGVIYIEQFEPRTAISFTDYLAGLSTYLFNGITALKRDGVEHIIIDQSGNRGGYIAAGAVAMWSLWPNDLYPGFPAVFRDLDIARRESAIAATQGNESQSEFYYGYYRDLNYNYLQNNTQFMDPPIPQQVNGQADAFSNQFFDDFGVNSSAVTNFTSPPFAPADIIFVANSICGSTCSIFSSYLYQKHGIRSAVFGGLPDQSVNDAQFDGGVKGSEVTDLGTRLAEIASVGLANDTQAPQALPINAILECNFRNAIPYIDKQDQILEFVFEGATKHYQFTKQTFNKPQAIWEYAAGQFWGQN